jgi:hypothetical protein
MAGDSDGELGEPSRPRRIRKRDRHLLSAASNRAAESKTGNDAEQALD